MLPVGHFFDFLTYPESRWEILFEEFEACGATHLTIAAPEAEQMLSRPVILGKFRKMGEKYHLKFHDAHGLHGYDQAWDLNVENQERRPVMLELHRLCIRMLASLGVKTYTMHIGAQACYRNGWFGRERELRELALASLEKLLPTAEREGVVIAIENSFEPSNTPDELLYYIDRIKSPALGICFDAGHAVMMSDDAVPRDRDENEDRHRKVAWNGQLRFQHDALGMLSPWIVTAHLHDNDGHQDLHDLIFRGVADWGKYIRGLRKCPKLLSIQDEVRFGGAPIALMCKAFDRLMKLS